MALQLGACGRPVEVLEFSETFVDLGGGRVVGLELANAGSAAFGPVMLEARSVQDTVGRAIIGARVVALPGEIATMNPGAVREVVLTLEVPEQTPVGVYSVPVEARLADGNVLASVELTFSIRAAAGNGDEAATVEIATGPAEVRQGDVHRFTAIARDEGGAILSGFLDWSVEPGTAGFVGDDGGFVGYEPGVALLVVRVGSVADTLEITILPRRSESGSEGERGN